MEYDLTNISTTVEAVKLDLAIRDIDPGGDAGSIDIYSYNGHR